MYTEIERKYTRQGYFVLYYSHYDKVWKYWLKYIQDNEEKWIDKFETKYFAIRRMNKMIKLFGGEVKK